MNRITISKDYVVDILKEGQKPAAFCESGDTAVFETRDCYDDNDITEELPLGSSGHDGLENPATGPLYVKGAEPGDVLKVEILDIRLREYGIMRTSPTDGAFHHLYEKRTARRFYFEKRTEEGDKGGEECCAQEKLGFRFDDRLWVDCQVMIGVIGTAAAGDGVLTITPGTHGGNLDCTKIGVGTSLYLPVNTPGALLAIGDLHARMGDGEMMICGMETAGTVTVKVTVLKKEAAGPVREAVPFLETAEAVMSIQSAETLDEAAEAAARKMEHFLTEAAGLDDVNAGMLLSLMGNLVVCQIVNPLKTVRCELTKTVLERYGVKLP
ncbi:MAG: acetamidase/formamidase family protein [Lachnospiraceae bacterium]|nr:acetamidase/formamidase family protein [Lachnospiraceae bacterium]